MTQLSDLRLGCKQFENSRLRLVVRAVSKAFRRGVGSQSQYKMQKLTLSHAAGLWTSKQISHRHFATKSGSSRSMICAANRRPPTARILRCV
eukprot:5511772-Pleurochrysis_carterae.AAC.4